MPGQSLYYTTVDNWTKSKKTKKTQTPGNLGCGQLLKSNLIYPRFYSGINLIPFKEETHSKRFQAGDLQ